MTDHAAEARKHIDWVHGWQEEAGSTEETNFANALVAQAEATLALVEQQRVANLLSAVRLNFRDGKADITKPWVADADTPEWSAIRYDIDRALGLEGTDEHD